MHLASWRGSWFSCLPQRGMQCASPDQPSRARHCQTLDRSRIEPQTGGSNKILELILGGCARNRSCQTRTRDQPGKCNLRGRGLALGRHLVERCQNATPTLIQVLAHALTTPALPEVSFRAVLARQKPARKGVVADHPQTVLAAVSAIPETASAASWRH